ncbi:MAG: 50S ribosomal protein L9 [Opitutales bacterium]
MSVKEVLLLQPVEGLGAEGEQVTVKPGYARNYLLPRKLAIPMTQANRKQMEALQARRDAREAKLLGEAQELASRVINIKPVFAVKTGEGGKMFGAITVGDILAKLEEGGMTLDKKQVLLEAPVKELGKHAATVKLHTDVVVELSFEIVSENPIEEGAEEEAAEA